MRTHDRSSRAGPSPLLSTVYEPRAQTHLAGALAAAFLAGEWTEDELVRRAGQAIVPAPRWIRRVAAAVLAAYHRPPVDRPRELARYVRLAIGRLDAEPPIASRPRVRRWFLSREHMGRRRWPVAELETTADLGDLLRHDPGRLDWLADARGLERSVDSERLRNYRYAWLPRKAAPPRAIERPKSMLKAAQRQVLREVLDHIPAHDAAHGYSEGVAHALTALCTNVLPRAEWAALPRPSDPQLIGSYWRLGRRLATPHLPQGAPTSPALASLVAFSLDRRLTGLAARFGARYTRYADDLAFSGEAALAPRTGRLAELVAEIARDEGFRLNEAKTRPMPRSTRQQLCGVVVNEHPNVPRREYDLLKAILHDAARHGPAAANRDGHRDFRAHLLGRIAWVEQLNPARGRRLRERFAAIAWPDA